MWEIYGIIMWNINIVSPIEQCNGYKKCYTSTNKNTHGQCSVWIVGGISVWEFFEHNHSKP